MKLVRALASGWAGAAALTMVHQVGRRVLAHPPRVDVLGRRAIAHPIRAMGLRQPGPASLQTMALGGDLVSNGLYYSLMALGEPRHLWARATALGLAAGVGAVALPPVMGLGRKPTTRRVSTALLTVLWYCIGAWVTAAAYEAVSEEQTATTGLGERVSRAGRSVREWVKS